MKKSENRAAFGSLKLFVDPFRIFAASGRNSENVFGSRFDSGQTGSSAAEHDSRREFFRIKLIAEIFFYDLKKFFDSRLCDLVDRLLRNLIVADFEIAVEPDFLVFILGSKNGVRMFEFYFFGLRVTDSKSETEII